MWRLKWRLLPNTLIVCADFYTLKVGKVVWQRSCVCQHKHFIQNMLSLISEFQGTLGHAHLFVLSLSPFCSFCALWQS